jgi:hypothetical protein
MSIRSGIWMTDGGSRLDLRIDGTKVSGYYSSAHGQPKPDERFPVTGFINGDLIGFVCSWEKYQSVTSWCGRYERLPDGRECIKTVWHLGRLFADKVHAVPTEEASFTFLTYSGTYYRVQD